MNINLWKNNIEFIFVLVPKIKQEKDFHLENKEKKLVVTAYNKALQQNIKTAVNTGDLIEACPVYHNKKYEVVLKELEAALYYMPDIWQQNYY